MLLWLGGKQLKKELKRKNKSRVELWARKVVANGDAVGTFWLRCPDLGRQLVKRGNSSGMMICKEITVAYHAFFSFLSFVSPGFEQCRPSPLGALFPRQILRRQSPTHQVRGLQWRREKKF